MPKQLIQKKLSSHYDIRLDECLNNLEYFILEKPTSRKSLASDVLNSFGISNNTKFDLLKELSNNFDVHIVEDKNSIHLVVAKKLISDDRKIISEDFYSPATLTLAAIIGCLIARLGTLETSTDYKMLASNKLASSAESISAKNTCNTLGCSDFSKLLAKFNLTFEKLYSWVKHEMENEESIIHFNVPEATIGMLLKLYQVPFAEEKVHFQKTLILEYLHKSAKELNHYQPLHDLLGVQKPSELMTSNTRNIIRTIPIPHMPNPSIISPPPKPNIHPNDLATQNGQSGILRRFISQPIWQQASIPPHNHIMPSKRAHDSASEVIENPYKRQRQNENTHQEPVTNEEIIELFLEEASLFTALLDPAEPQSPRF